MCQSISQQKWDKKYQAKESTPTSAPPIFLQQQLASLKSGRVLDLACGDGAASLFLAEQGFTVHGADISPVGLQRLQDQAVKQGLKITTAVVDLESEPLDLSGLGTFDSIVLSRYKPNHALLCHLAKRLVPEGRLLLTTFNQFHHQRTGFSARFCMQPAEFSNVTDELLLLNYEEDIEASGMDGYLFAKRS